MSKRSTDERPTDDAHLAQLPSGAGCVEIWERLSDYRTTTAGRLADD